jgi:putative NADH-flavin reductase
MRLVVIGASGRTGSQVVGQALERGHRVTAIARRPEEVALRHNRLVSVAADVLDEERLVEVFYGAEAVVSAVGIGSSRRPTRVYSDGTANVLRAMRHNHVMRIAVISAAPVGPRREQPFLERRLAMPILERIFGATYADMRSMEELLNRCDRSWVALRPPRLVDKPATGHYRIASQPLANARTITIPDLATALLDAIDHKDFHRHALYVAA